MSYRPVDIECPDCGYDIYHPLDDECPRCDARVGEHCTERYGQTTHYAHNFHRERVDQSHSRLNAPTFRARFVGRDGRSFFENVTPGREVWFLIEFPLVPFSLFREDVEPSADLKAYRREIWRGVYPMASPMWTRDGGWVDVVYRYESG